LLFSRTLPTDSKASGVWQKSCQSLNPENQGSDNCCSAGRFPQIQKLRGFDRNPANP